MKQSKMYKYCIINCKTWSVLCKPKKGTKGISQLRRYRQSYDDIDPALEILKTTKGRAEQELEWLQNYVGPKEAPNWEIVEEDDLPPF